MKGKIRELVAIGASIGANCTSCLKHHLRLAREYGASEEEIKEAIQVALLVKKNSTRSLDQLIKTTIEGNNPSENKICC